MPFFRTTLISLCLIGLAGCSPKSLFYSLRPGVHREGTESVLPLPLELDSSLARVRTLRYAQVPLWNRSWNLDLLFDKRTDTLFALEWSTASDTTNEIEEEVCSIFGQPVDTTGGLLWKTEEEAIGLIRIDSMVLLRRGYSN